jgi:predicted alpha/beta-fold hydrolase
LTSDEEFEKLLNYIREKSDKMMVGVGLSMGGNLLIRNAAELQNFPLKAIVTVNNPFDIWLAINLMRGKVYEKHLTEELKRNLVLRTSYTQTAQEKELYAKMIQKFGIDLDRLKTVKTWRDFDEEFTRKVHP